MEKWKIDSLKREYGDSLVKCSDTNKEGKRRLVTVKDFLDYCECQTDLDPLYVFDPGFPSCFFESFSFPFLRNSLNSFCNWLISFIPSRILEEGTTILRRLCNPRLFSCGLF